MYKPTLKEDKLTLKGQKKTSFSRLPTIQEFNKTIINECIEPMEIKNDITTYETIIFSPIAKKIIETPFFQSSYKKHQLGTQFFFLKDSEGTRGKHMEETYHLAKLYAKSLFEKSNEEEIKKSLLLIPELQEYFKLNNYQITDHFIELIGLAGLMHDIGHSAFSHCFDEYLESINLKHEEYNDHEFRGQEIINHMFNNISSLQNILNQNEILFIIKLISPKKQYESCIYNLISDSKAGMDPDKGNYIGLDTKILKLGNYVNSINLIFMSAKIINNEICFPNTMKQEIFNFYNLRYLLYKYIYCPPEIVAINFMITDCLKLIDSLLNIHEAIYDMEKMNNFTDEYILNLIKTCDINLLNNMNDKKNIIEAKIILHNIYTKNFYKNIIDHTFSMTNKNIGISFINSIGKNNICDFENCKMQASYGMNRCEKCEIHKSNKMINFNNVKIFSSTIGLLSGKKSNPLTSIKYYEKEQTKKIMDINITSYQEFIFMIFHKNKFDINEHKRIKQLFYEFIANFI